MMNRIRSTRIDVLNTTIDWLNYYLDKQRFDDWNIGLHDSKLLKLNYNNAISETKQASKLKQSQTQASDYITYEKLG